MKIPEKIKIGGFAYDVERPEQPFVSDGAALDGEHDFAEKKIRVAQRGCSEYQEVVFLHEVCHGIIECYAPGHQNEGLVEQFSKGLYQVLIDNPGVFDAAVNRTPASLPEVVMAFVDYVLDAVFKSDKIADDAKQLIYGLLCSSRKEFLFHYGNKEENNEKD